LLFRFLLLHKSINIEIFTVGMPSLISSQLLKAAVQWHLWPFLAIFSRFWPFLATFGHFWPFLAIFGRFGPL